MVHAIVAVATDGRDRVDFDKTYAVIRHSARGLGDPYTVIHEFSHLYHIKNWPELTAAAPDYRCEAAAALAEIRLGLVVPQIGARVRERYQIWGGKVKHLLSVMPPGADFDLHEEMRKTLAGDYG